MNISLPLKELLNVATNVFKFVFLQRYKDPQEAVSAFFAGSLLCMFGIPLIELFFNWITVSILGLALYDFLGLAPREFGVLIVVSIMFCCFSLVASIIVRTTTNPKIMTVGIIIAIVGFACYIGYLIKTYCF